MIVIFSAKHDDHHAIRQAKILRSTDDISLKPDGRAAREILEEASRLFRDKGIAGTSIAQVMKASGLTHGEFYTHFDSKDALACASLEHAMDQLALRLRDTVSSSDAPKQAFGQVPQPESPRPPGSRLRNACVGH